MDAVFRTGPTWRSPHVQNIAKQAMDVPGKTGTRVPIVCSRKIISITYSECVFVALVMLRAMGTICIILSYVACMTLPRFTTVSQRRYEFQYSDEHVSFDIR